jgi:deoxyxylulose-5-phosphate synthase
METTTTVRSTAERKLNKNTGRKHKIQITKSKETSKARNTSFQEIFDHELIKKKAKSAKVPGITEAKEINRGCPEALPSHWPYPK